VKHANLDEHDLHARTCATRPRWPPQLKTVSPPTGIYRDRKGLSSRACGDHSPTTELTLDPWPDGTGICLRNRCGDRVATVMQNMKARILGMSHLAYTPIGYPTIIAGQKRLTAPLLTRDHDGCRVPDGGLRRCGGNITTLRARFGTGPFFDPQSWPETSAAQFPGKLCLIVRADLGARSRDRQSHLRMGDNLRLTLTSWR
jgi:hypothetical protein